MDLHGKKAAKIPYRNWRTKRWGIEYFQFIGIIGPFNRSNHTPRFGNDSTTGKNTEQYPRVWFHSEKHSKMPRLTRLTVDRQPPPINIEFGHSPAQPIRLIHILHLTEPNKTTGFSFCALYQNGENIPHSEFNLINLPVKNVILPSCRKESSLHYLQILRFQSRIRHLRTIKSYRIRIPRHTV